MPRLIASVALVALVLAPAASAHPAFERGFAPAGAEASLVLVVPNERRVLMTGLELAAPPSVTLRGAESTDGWRGSVDGQRASWTGRRLRFLAAARVVVRLTPTGRPGPATFRVRQLFADGRAVNWPLELTITPGSGGAGDGGLAVAAYAVIGIAAAASLVFVLWLRRRRLAVS
jgi:hypothetical protein